MRKSTRRDNPERRNGDDRRQEIISVEMDRRNGNDRRDEEARRSGADRRDA